MFMVFYAYFGYQLSLLLIRIFRQNEQIRQLLDAPVTFIIAA
ncbi:glycosyltransferase family 2 protein, partial [Nitrosomonas sp. JL21]|nr:glycosyltransferase family 2 protein [Nitrosomonas sp. JL21]